MRRSFRVVVGVFAASLGACGLLYDPSELSSEYGRAEPGEAGPDGTTSSSGSSGTANVDGGIDARPDDGAAARFCDGIRATRDAALCDDFDDDGGIGGKWSSVKDAGAFGSLALDVSPDQASLTSAPFALVAIAGNTASEREGPNLQFDDPRKTGRRVSFSARIESADPTAQYRLVDLVIAEQRYFLDVHGRTIDLVMALGADVFTYPIDGVDLTEMTAMVFEVDTKQRIATVTVDGTVKQSQNPPAPSETGPSVLRIGLPNVRSVQTVRVRYDNVIVE